MGNRHTQLKVETERTNTHTYTKFVTVSINNNVQNLHDKQSFFYQVYKS